MIETLLWFIYQATRIKEKEINEIINPELRDYLCYQKTDESEALYTSAEGFERTVYSSQLYYCHDVIQ